MSVFCPPLLKKAFGPFDVELAINLKNCYYIHTGELQGISKFHLSAWYGRCVSIFRNISKFLLLSALLISFFVKLFPERLAQKTGSDRGDVCLLASSL
jgi:hypothetical protein